MSKKSEFYSPMPRMMLSIMIAALMLCAMFTMLYKRMHCDWMFSCGISFGVTAYHMMIRFLSPIMLEMLFHKQYDYKSKWFCSHKWEPGVYRLIGVKRWKKKLGNFTYAPSEFSMKIHSPEEIVRNMCHAELVHELIIVLSYTSLFFSIPFGSFGIFLATATLAAMIDMMFVVLQRYNRPRMIKIMEHKK